MSTINLTHATTERTKCAKSARYWSDAAEEVAAKGLDWIATTYRAKSDEYQARANDLSVALRAILISPMGVQQKEAV